MGLAQSDNFYDSEAEEEEEEEKKNPKTKTQIRLCGSAGSGPIIVKKRHSIVNGQLVEEAVNAAEEKLKAEIEQLQLEIDERDMHIQDLTTETGSLKEVNDKLALEVLDLQSRLSSKIGENAKLQLDLEDEKNNAINLREEERKHQLGYARQMDLLEKQNEELQGLLEKKDKELEELTGRTTLLHQELTEAIAELGVSSTHSRKLMETVEDSKKKEESMQKAMQQKLASKAANAFKNAKQRRLEREQEEAARKAAAEEEAKQRQADAEKRRQLMADARPFESNRVPIALDSLADSFNLKVKVVEAETRMPQQKYAYVSFCVKPKLQSFVATKSVLMNGSKAQWFEDFTVNFSERPSTVRFVVATASSPKVKDPKVDGIRSDKDEYVGAAELDMRSLFERNEDPKTGLDLGRAFEGFVDIKDVDDRTTARLRVQVQAKIMPRIQLKFECGYGHSEVTKLLRYTSARLDDPDTKGRTHLHRAVKELHTDTMRVLVEAKADAEALDRKGMTALMLAAKSGVLETVEVLLAREPQPDVNVATAKHSVTALMFAASQRHLNVVEYLLKHGNGIKVDLTDTAGMSALLIAANVGDVSVVRMLLQHGANPNIQTTTGWSAMMIACKLGFPDVIRELRAGGADPQLRASDGKSVFDIAAELDPQNSEINSVVHSMR